MLFSSSSRMEEESTILIPMTMANAAATIEVMNIPKITSALTSTPFRFSRYSFNAILTVPSHQYTANSSTLPSEVAFATRLITSHRMAPRTYTNAPVARALIIFGIG